MYEEVPPDWFQFFGNEIIRRGKAQPEFKAEKIAARKFSSFFGTTPFICSLLWAFLEPCTNMPIGVKPQHLLWALLFLKVYATESVHCALVGGVDEKTFRKWSWLFVHAIAGWESGVILWSNRKLGALGNELIFVTVDGTDFRIWEPRKPCFWTGWFSEKFNHPAVRYEICVSKLNGDIVWINGPFPAGQFPDRSIFRQKLMMYLDPTEMVDADEGYEGEDVYIRIPSDLVEGSPEAIEHARSRARQETLNRRLKTFNILHQTYRHHLDDHGSVLRAVAVIVQLGIKHGGMPLFD